MINGALLERFERPRTPGEVMASIREAFPLQYPQLGARFVDLGGERPQIKPYLSQLEKSFTFAMRTALGAAVITLLCIFDLMASMQGENYLHPVIDFLLGIAALCLAIVAVYSGFTSINYLKKTISEICQTSLIS